jgi:tetratricopeptide (TPR) repeat protein
MGEPSTQERAIRIFVSSTFRDMVAERDVLVNRAFPQLRALCAERGVAFTEIDLRWGLTDEEVAEGKVLPICLQEIRRCRPYFIGLLGERYGWVPPEIPSDLRARESWLIPHSGQSSVTELEILYGVLNDPEMEHNAFFYLRDPSYIGSERFLEDTKDDPLGQALFVEPSDEARAKLAHLKESLRASRYPVLDYTDPDQLGELIVADLTALIERRFPAADKLNQFAVETRRHDFFAESRSRVYVRRPSYFEALDDFAEQEKGAVISVLGDPGAGKSSLLATWGLGYRSRHPEELVLMHFIGSSQGSGELGPMLGRLSHELGRFLGVEESMGATAAQALDGGLPVGTDEPDPAQVFRQRLHAAGAKSGVVLVLDGLDQLSDEGAPRALRWLPSELPPGVRLVVSTAKGETRGVLEQRGWLESTLRVRPLEPPERAELIRLFLGSELAKSLSAAQLQRIVELPQAESPLYLRILLDELRVWGRHETLDSRIGRLTGASTVAALLELVLARYERAFESDGPGELGRPGLVGEAMRLLWASHHGLEEGELLGLLGDGDERLPAALWAPLRIAASEMLVDRDGLIGFAHVHFRSAVESRYLADADARASVRGAIADSFETPSGQVPTERALDERVPQLAELEAWEELAELLASPPWFVALWRRDRFEPRRLWAKIHANSTIRAGDSYLKLSDDVLTAVDGQLLPVIASMVAELGGPAEALLLLERGRAMGQRAPSLSALCSACQATIHLSRGELEPAAALYAECEQTYRELGDLDSLAFTLNSLANIRSTRGELDQAFSLSSESERAYRDLRIPYGIASALDTQMNIHLTRGELDRADAVSAESERIYRELKDPDGLAHTLINRAGIHEIHGEFEQALALSTEAEALYREIGNPAGTARALNRQANIHRLRGALDQATSLYAAAEQIYRGLEDRSGLAAVVGNQASICVTRGELDRALELNAEAERTYRELGDPSGLAFVLNSRAAIYASRGELESALELYTEAEPLYRQLGDRSGLAATLNNLGNLFDSRGERERAISLHAEAIGLYRELGDAAGLARSLNNQGNSHSRNREPERAKSLYVDAERILRSGDIGDDDEDAVGPTVDRQARLTPLAIADSPESFFLDFAESRVPRALAALAEQNRTGWDGAPLLLLLIPEHPQLDAYSLRSEPVLHRNEILRIILAEEYLPTAAALALSDPSQAQAASLPNGAALSVSCFDADGRTATSGIRLYEDANARIEFEDLPEQPKPESSSAAALQFIGEIIPMCGKFRSGEEPPNPKFWEEMLQVTSGRLPDSITGRGRQRKRFWQRGT